MFGLGAGELLIIFVFALIFIGPKKLPELAKSLGKGLREFQKAKDDFVNVIQQEADSIESETSKHEKIADSQAETDHLDDAARPLTEEELVAMGNVEGVSHDGPTIDEIEESEAKEQAKKDS